MTITENGRCNSAQWFTKKFKEEQNYVQKNYKNYK